MFGQLSDRLSQTFNRLAGRGLLTEADVDGALRDVRIALLEADVALPVIKRFMTLVRERAVGDKVLKAIKPDQQVIKVVNDALVEVLGPGEELNLNAQKPVIILMAGLQGSGKTTSAGKLAKRLQDRHNKKVLLASLDVYRPAAREQLQTLAERIGGHSLEIIADEKPLAITRRAIDRARKEAFDVLILDTAGRIQIDEAMMAELKDVQKLAQPTETLLVADALTGQSAVDIATAFKEAVNITGLILTRIDGDGRGGAALSMREVTGCPIKYLGAGEQLDALSPFNPERIANRILGMGDVVELVERAQQAVSPDDMLEMQERMMSNRFNLNDLKKQMRLMQKMGSIKGMLNLLPGFGKFKDKIDESRLNDKVIVHQIAIIDSMTPAERKNPDMMNARRRKRVAEGAGLTVHDVNKLLKSYDQMRKMMKKMSGMNKKGLLPKGFGGM